jgi:hypothetical protein
VSVYRHELFCEVTAENAASVGAPAIATTIAAVPAGLRPSVGRSQ